MTGFPGFDCSGYPRDADMQAIKSNTNLTWCGFDLGPAPSHLDTSSFLHYMRDRISNIMSFTDSTVRMQFVLIIARSK